MTPEQISATINEVPAGWQLVSVMVPTRALRIIRNDLALIFRVEQLDPRPPKFTWRVVSTHAGEIAWESHEFAWAEAKKMQARFIEKVKLAQHENNMARIKAQNT